MSCFLVNVKTNEGLVAIDKLLSLEFKGGIITINGIVELKPEEILEIRYKREAKNEP